MAEGGSDDFPSSRKIYNLITANNLEEIRSLLNPLTLRHRQSIICQKVDNKTLIGYACQLCLRDIVKYLLDECEADISELYPDDYVSLSPLRVSINNLDVSMLVLLISRGALFADGNEAISCSLHTLTIKCFTIYAILSNYADTIGSLELASRIPELMSLVLYTRINNDHPYLRAAIDGDVDGLKALLSDNMDPRAITDSGENALCLTIRNEQRNAEHLLLNYRIFYLKDHVKALEFSGAKFIAFESELDKGMQCWRKSMRIRTETLLGVSDKFENLVSTELGLEFQCEEELDKLENYEPGIYIQSLIILVRLLSTSSPVLYNAFFTVARHPIFRTDLLQSIKILAALTELPYLPVSRRVNQIHRAIDTLDVMLRIHFGGDPTIMDNVLTNLRSILGFIKGVNWGVLLMSRAEFYPFVYMHLLRIVIYNLIALNKHVSSINNLWIKDGISDICKWHPDPYPTTLLHMALSIPAAYGLIPFILSCVDDANCRDNQGNNPMHIVSLQTEDNSELLRLVNLLADAGGHIDLINEQGLIPSITLKLKGVIIHSLKFQSLQCLAAHAIRNNNVPIPEHYPKILTSFIKLHS